MTDFIKRLSENKITIASIFIILGILCIIFPLQIVGIASLVFGIILFIYAVFQLATILALPNPIFMGFSIVASAFSFILALVLILNNDAGTLAIGLITGIWALIAGITHLSQVFILKSLHLPILDKLVVGIIELLIAILMFCNTVKMVALQIILLGVIFIIYGIYTITMYLYILKKNKAIILERQEKIAKGNDDTIEIVIEEDK